MKKIYSSICIVCMMLLSVSSAQASIVNFTLTGTVESAVKQQGKFLFGLEENASITASGWFDDSVFTTDLSGNNVFSFIGSSNDMTITAGTATFLDIDDVLGGADLILAAGSIDSNSFVGLNYAATTGDFNSSFANFLSTTRFAGNWDTFSATVTPVPVPAALWLMGSGLIGLAGVARRKQK